MSIINGGDDDIDVRKLLREARATNTALELAQKYRRIDYANPSPKQQEVLDCDKFACFFMAANQVGKSQVMAWFATNVALQRDKLPGWKGWKQPKNKLERQYSIIIWFISPTNLVSMSGMQARTLGAASGPAMGTGTFPLECIESVSVLHGMSGCIESFTFRRPDGTLGLVRFKSIAQQREALQSEAVDIVVIDELPSGPEQEAILAELLSRLSATGGCIRMAATALRQASPIVEWFKDETKSDRIIIHGNRTHATHISAEDNQRFLESLPTQADIDTRYWGLEWSGQGPIYSTPFSELEDTMRPEDFP
jgi:phage terminase large subunit-like protein